MILEHVRAFVRVAELASFTRAAEQLGIPKARVSLRVKALETELGVRLLQRTTRAVRTTVDGEQFLLRARQLIADTDQLASMFQGASALRGRVRIDLPLAFAREALIPRLPELLARHPQLELLLSVTDRRVELVREGFDLVLRIGALADSGLSSRRLGSLAMTNCASPDYLRRYGTPRTPADLDRHLLVHYSLTLGEEPTFEYRDGARYRNLTMRALVTVNNTDAYTAAGLAGLGIVQVPRYGVLERVKRGELVEILPAFTCAPLDVSLVHAHGKQVPKRVRAVMDWISSSLQVA